MSKRVTVEPGTSPSPREIEVLQLVADGLGDEQIASRLYISHHTVKMHLRHIFYRFSVKNRAHAVAEGFRKGIIQ